MYIATWLHESIFLSAKLLQFTEYYSNVAWAFWVLLHSYVLKCSKLKICREHFHVSLNFAKVLELLVFSNYVIAIIMHMLYRCSVIIKTSDGEVIGKGKFVNHG